MTKVLKKVPPPPIPPILNGQYEVRRNAKQI